MQQPHTEAPQIRYDGEQRLYLESRFALNAGTAIDNLVIQVPNQLKPSSPGAFKQLRGTLKELHCSLEQRYLTTLVSRTLSGGGLSDLQIQVMGARIEISGVLSREGRRTPFCVRGFLYEKAGPLGGAVFYDLRLFGRPGLPAPAIIPLLVARTGRQGPVKVSGAVTLQFDALSLLLRWGLAGNGWKIPNYRHINLHQITMDQAYFGLSFQPNQARPVASLASLDPQYNQWMQLRQVEQQFLAAEELLGNGDYDGAAKLYEEQLWQNPGHHFLQERLMQLYIGSAQAEDWKKAGRIAEELLQKNPQDIHALNCLAQYAEGTQNIQRAAQFYLQIADIARHNKEHVEAALAYSKAAELLEPQFADRAHALWQQARHEDPSYRPAIAALARHALKAGHFHEAEAVLLDLIEQTPPSIERARHHLSLAGLYRSRLRQLPEARAQLEQAAPYLSEDVSYQRELAEFRLATDENLEALRILDMLVERLQQLNHTALCADLLFRTGQILEERLAHPGAALRRYRRVLEFRSNHPHSIHRIRALEASQVEEEDFFTDEEHTLDLQINEKERLLQREGQLPPSERSVLMLELARLHWQREDTERALKSAYEAIQIQSELEPAWQFLEEICVRTGRQQELARIHSEMAKKSLFDLDAIRHLEKALRLVPSDIELLEQLSERYQKLEQWDKLDTLYQRWIEASPQNAAALWLSRARLLEDQLKKDTEAELAYLQAYQLASHNKQHLEALIRFYVKREDWNKLDRQLERFALALSKPEQAELYAAKGRILRTIYKQTDRALAAYQKALILDPEHLPSLRASVDLLREQSKYQELFPFLSQLAQLADQTEEKISTRLELAELLEEQLHQEDRAYEEYNNVLMLDDKHPVALKRLAQIDQRSHRWTSAVEHWERLREVLPPKPIERIQGALEHIIALYARLDRTADMWKTTSQLLEAQPQFGQNILKKYNVPSEKSETRVLLQLGEQMGEAPLFLEAYRELREPAPELAAQCWERAFEREPFLGNLWSARMLEAQAADRAPLWERLAELLSQTPPNEEQQQNLNPLFETLQHAGLELEELRSIHKLLNEKSLSIPQLTRLFGQRLEDEGEMEEALQVRLRLLEGLPPSPERVGLNFELAIQQLHLLGDREEGKAQLWNVLAQDPSHGDAFAELQNIYEEDQDLENFVKKLEGAANIAPPGQSRAELTIRTFELYRHLLMDEAEALQMLQRAAEQASNDPETLQAIAISYEELEAKEEAARIYLQLGDIAKDDDATRSFERAAEIYQHDLEMPDEAMIIYQKLLDKSPKYEPAIEALKSIYETLWMWEELATLIENQAKNSDPAQRAQKLFELAELFLGRQGDYERALQTYRQALRYDPRNLQILQSLQALYEELSDWPAVVSALKARSRAEVDPARLYDTFMRIADISLTQIEKLEDAEKYYRLAHTQQPQRSEPLRGLLELLDTQGQHVQAAPIAAQLAILQLKQGHQAESRESLQLLISAAQADEAVGSAEDILRKVILEQQESAETAQLIFNLLLNEASDLEDPLPLSSRLYQNSLLELSWILRLSETEEDFLPEEDLEQMRQLARDKSWDELAKKLEALGADEESSEEDRASFILAAAEIQWYCLERGKKTQELAEKSLELGAYPERSLSLLAKVLKKKKTNNREDFVALLQHVEIPEDQTRAAFHLGGVFARQGLWADSLSFLLDALAAEPENREALASQKNLQLLDVAIKKGKQPGTAMFSTISDRLPERYRLLLQAWLMFLAEEEEKAWELLEESVSIEAEFTPSLRLLGQNALFHDQKDSASEFLFRFLEIEWDRLPFDEVVELCTQLAQIATERGDWENALFYIDQAYKFIPEDSRILALHIRVLKAADWRDQLRELFLQRIEAPEPSDQVADLWFQLGQLYSQQLDNQTEAQFCFEQAIKVFPLHEGALRSLGRWIGATDDNLAAVTV
ncbi:MAG: tetratricopeptide repeat protein [Myxococcales bacterium]|nr:tetratricopeptide repeat protein [Myxococcales bacterium]